MVNCPKCNVENQDNAMNCKSCHINLAFAFSHPDEFGLEKTTQSLPSGGETAEFIINCETTSTTSTKGAEEEPKIVIERDQIEKGAASDQRARREGRLSTRDRNIMMYTGGGMLAVMCYLGNLESHFFALFISTAVGTAIGYFLVPENVIAVVISAICTFILLIIAQFLSGSTWVEFIMWWQLAIFVFSIYSLAATLLAFGLVDEIIEDTRKRRDIFNPNQN